MILSEARAAQAQLAATPAPPVARVLSADQTRARPLRSDVETFLPHRPVGPPALVAVTGAQTELLSKERLADPVTVRHRPPGLTLTSLGRCGEVELPLPRHHHARVLVVIHDVVVKVPGTPAPDDHLPRIGVVGASTASNPPGVVS